MTAETGADFAMAALRKTLTKTTSAWNDWALVDANGIPLPEGGAIVAKTVSMTGNTSVHYDEALASVDFVTDYKVASWFEDRR